MHVNHNTIPNLWGLTSIGQFRDYCTNFSKNFVNILENLLNIYLQSFQTASQLKI